MHGGVPFEFIGGKNASKYAQTSMYTAVLLFLKLEGHLQNVFIINQYFN